MSNEFAILVIEDEIKSLDSKLESNYDRIDQIKHANLPSGASWDITINDVDLENDEIQEKINSLEETVELLKKLDKVENSISSLEEVEAELSRNS